MRWEALFADLEGRLVAEERRELDDEVAERTRRERALVTLSGRLAASVGAEVRLCLVDGVVVHGRLLDLGVEWLLVRGQLSGREVVVPLGAVRTLDELGRRAEDGRSARRFALGYALRALSRDRATVAVRVAGGGPALVGTIDAVGADHLDLAQHPDGVPRRRENVTAVTTVPFAALVAVESLH
jgi:hypothetical protein